MNCLQKLIVSCYPSVNNFNIPRVLEHVESLKELVIQSYNGHLKPDDDHLTVTTPVPVVPDCDLRKEMEGEFPTKLSRVEFFGNGFKSLAENVLNVGNLGTFINSLLLL